MSQKSDRQRMPEKGMSKGATEKMRDCAGTSSVLYILLIPIIQFVYNPKSITPQDAVK